MYKVFSYSSSQIIQERLAQNKSRVSPLHHKAPQNRKGSWGFGGLLEAPGNRTWLKKRKENNADKPGKHKLGSSDVSGYHYQRWQKHNNTIPPSTTANTEAHNPITQLANKEISNSFWQNPDIFLKQQINVMKYQTDTLYTQRHAFSFNFSSSSRKCPLCDDMDHIDHLLLKCTNSTMSGMHTNRHHEALSLCVKAFSKGRRGSSFVGMDGCSNKRLLDQGIEVPENITRDIPDWVFPNSTGSPARHQSRPDFLFVRPIPGRQAHLDPSKIPPQDRDIHL
eukprot:1161041-Pelagomonas_calceolata.AAC.1